VSQTVSDFIQRSSFQSQRLLGLATGVFGTFVICVTASLGYVILRLGQLGTFAEQALDRLLPVFIVGFVFEIFLFLLIGFFLANFLAQKLSGPLDLLEKEIEESLQDEQLRPLQVSSGHVMAGLASKINGLMEVLSQKSHDDKRHNFKSQETS